MLFMRKALISLIAFLFLHANMLLADIELDLSVIPSARSVSAFDNGIAQILNDKNTVVGRIVYSSSQCDSIKGLKGSVPIIVVLDDSDFIKTVILRENNEPDHVLQLIKQQQWLTEWNGYPITGALTKNVPMVVGAETTCSAIIKTFQQTLHEYSSLSKTIKNSPQNKSTIKLPQQPIAGTTNQTSNISTASSIQSVKNCPTSNNSSWNICSPSNLSCQLGGNNTQPLTVPQNNSSANIQKSYSGSAQATKSIQEIIELGDRVGCGSFFQKAIEEADPLIWSERIKNEQRETRKVLIIIIFLLGIAFSCIITYCLSVWCPFAKLLLEPVKLIKEQIIAIFKMPGGKTLFVVLVLAMCAGSVTTLSVDSVREWLFEKLGLLTMYYIVGFFWGFFIVIFILLALMVLGCFIEKFTIFDGVFGFFMKWVWVLLIPLIFIITLGFTMNFAWNLFQSNISKAQYVEACIKSAQSKSGPMFDSLPLQIKYDLFGFAVLSEYIYSASPNYKLPDNIKALPAIPLSGQYNSRTGIFNDATSGLGIQMLHVVDKNDIIVVFKGTEPTSTSDWYTDFAQYFKGEETKQYSFAVQLVSYLLHSYPSSNIILTGHSLGGGLAQYAAAYNSNNRLYAICFNSAGLSDSSLERIGNSNLASANSRIIHMRSTGDVVSEYGWHIGSMYNINLGAWTTAVSNNSLLRTIFAKYAHHNMTVLSNAMKQQL